MRYLLLAILFLCTSCDWGTQIINEMTNDSDTFENEKKTKSGEKRDVPQVREAHYQKIR